MPSVTRRISPQAVFPRRNPRTTLATTSPDEGPRSARILDARAPLRDVLAHVLFLGALSACAGVAEDEGAGRDAALPDGAPPSSRDASAHDANEEPDAAPALDDGGVPSDAVAPDAPDPAAPDAGPPQPACGPVDCASIPTTTLGRLRSYDECAHGLRLQRPLAEGRALADALLARLESAGLGQRRTLAQVAADLNRTGRAGLTSQTTTRLSGLSPVGFRWNTGDDAVDYWYPQGITGSADAGRADELLIVSWYHRTDERPTRGARITLADVSDLSSPRYRHLLLVDPVDGPEGPDFGPAEYDSGGALHAGGIAWVGDNLYVADTAQGLRVYDLSRIFRPSATNDNAGIGVSAGRSDAHGYAYAVPRVGRWRNAGGACAARFSFVARGDVGGAPALVSGDYRANDVSARVMAWPLDGAELAVDATGVAWARAAAVVGQTRVQGALRVGDAWYLSSSSQDGSNGRLYRATTSGTTSVPWVYGAEDLYRDARDRLWTPAEHPGRRDVVAIPRP